MMLTRTKKPSRSSGLQAPTTEVMVRLQDASLPGSLAIPAGAPGIVVFAHGSGSSRFSPRNRAVAASLNHAGFATLLFDLLSAEENEIDLQTGELRFDIGLLSERLVGAIDWLETQRDAAAMPVGLFGASTGAAAALRAAAERPLRVAAVVSRGGRPDLAGIALARVKAPTLLIVGGEDGVVIDMNRKAATQMHCTQRVDIIAGATHLFEEPGKLDQVARLAQDWFSLYLHRS